MTERDLAGQAGIAPSLVNRKRRQGKSDEQIREEAARRKMTAKPAKKSETYAQAQARKEQALADLRELELAEKEFRLIDRAGVESQAFATARTVRDSMLAIPDRISSLLAAENSAPKVHEALTQEIRKALAVVANAPVQSSV